ncbi:MAG: hypothetical protein IH987_08320 [Planctomycetes bacterium]|nr:hypothetical protein [Planctomycetota bacterium]
MTALWVPILLSAVFVFIERSISHVVIQIHKGDYKKIPGDERVIAEMKSHGIQPGTYTFPCPESTKDMGTPEMIEKYKKGPVGFMAVFK